MLNLWSKDAFVLVFYSMFTFNVIIDASYAYQGWQKYMIIYICLGLPDFDTA